MAFNLKDYRLFIFDWDGTLADSVSSIVESMQLAGSEIGETISTADARYIIGMGLEPAIHYLLPHLTDKKKMLKFIAVYKREFLHRQTNIRFYPYAEQTIVQLHSMGKILAIATGKSRAGLTSALEHIQVGNYFTATRTADETASKPDPKMLFEIMNECSTSCQETIMIGDTTHDLLMARNAGIDCIGMTHGAHSIEALTECEPLLLLNNFSEFLKIL